MKIGIRVEPMGALPSAALRPESDMRARIPPEMSNYYCHPGKAGGTLIPLDVKGQPLRDADRSIRLPSHSGYLQRMAGNSPNPRAAADNRSLGKPDAETIE